MRKGKIPNFLQTAISKKCNGMQAHVVDKGRFTDLGYALRNFDTDKICTVFKGIAPDLGEPPRECYFAETTLPRESKIADRGYNTPVNTFRNGNIASVTGIRADLHSAVIQNHIGIRYTIIFIDPLGIQGQVTVEGIGIILHSLRKGIVVIPSVKDSIQALRFGKLLQGVASDEKAFLIFQLIGKHIVCHSPSFFQKEGRQIQSTVTVLPVIT